MNHAIQFNKAHLAGNELRYIAQAIERGHLSSGGPFTDACQRLLEERLGFRRPLLVSSGTAALEIAALLCELGPGDEVIMPSFTFVSTASAVARLGAVPVFVDIRPDTLNLDERLIEAAISERTKALIPVHYAGVACEMDEISAIARAHQLLVIEDAAHALSARYKGRALGSLGDLACFSFHETKNYTCGEGGALVVNDARFEARAETIRDKGTNRRAFFRGEVDKYSWVDVGSSYGLSDLLSAFLLGQLEHMQALAERRLAIFQGYVQRFARLEAAEMLRLPHVPAHCETNAHNFYVLLRSAGEREGLRQHLAEASISAVFHYAPLHASPMGRATGRAHGALSVTDSVAERLLRLPFHCELSDDDLDRVTSELERYLIGRAVQPVGKRSLVA